MTLNRRAQSNFSTEDILTPNKRIVSENDINVTFAAGDSGAVLAVGYPVGYNESTGDHAPWMAPNASVLVVDIASRNAGTWGMTVNSLVIANDTFAWDVTAAVVVEALRTAGFNATVTLETKVYTITFDDEAQIKVIPSTLEADISLLSGGSDDATETEIAGTSTNGTHNIRGFIHPNVLSIGTITGSVALVVLTETDTVCTATQVTPHGLVTDMLITVTGATESKLNVSDVAITVLTSFTFTYTVAAVASGTVDSGVYTTTNQSMVLIMVKGQIHATLPEGLVDSGDLTALRTALKDSLLEKGITVQGLAGRF